MSKTLTKLSQALISGYSRDYFQTQDRAISVNPLVAELASWYEKFRTAMDYREDEVILRSAIERILKRRLLLSRDGQVIATPLIRELIWARYFPDAFIGDDSVVKVTQTIDLYLKLEGEINRKHRINKGVVFEWIIHLLSSEIEYLLKRNYQKDLMCNYMYHLFKDQVTVLDDTEEVKNIQVFIAVRRSFANDDFAFLRFHLFKHYFGLLSAHNLEKVADHFPDAIKQFSYYLKYPALNKIYTYIKKQTVPFLILDDTLRVNMGRNQALVADEDQLNLAILNACSQRYKSIGAKVRRAIVRSVIFIFFTKAIFALLIEGTFQNFLYGKVVWSSLTLNTLTPPALMVIVGLFIKPPSRENSYRILRKINSFLFDERPALDETLQVRKKPKGSDPLVWSLFIVLWLTTFALSFGIIVFILTELGVNPLSQAVFILFLAIVSFVSYRINKTANMYVLREEKENFRSLLFDFFFMPFIQVGQRLTLAVSQINIILFVFDFIIETPFKGIFAFFEQWLLFLRTQREKLD